jgi:ribosomal protein S18 acetylase RimI-like enzyme
MLGSSAHARIRRGKPSDAKALAAIFADSWRLAYRGIIPHLHLESMIRRRGPEWWASALRSGDNILVLEIDRTLAGYATWGFARARGPYQGEIYELYLAPVYQGLGFGEHLFEACRHAMDQRKLRGLICWSLAENTPAIEFYWRRGGRPIAQTFDNIGGERLEKIAFAWH